MAGGPREAFDLLEPTLKKIAAQVDGPCLGFWQLAARGVEKSLFSDQTSTRRRMHATVRHPQIERALELSHTGGAGNYVKMVHNGIEYGDMRCSLALLKRTRRTARGCLVRRRTARDF